MLEVASVVQVALGSRAFFAVSFCSLFRTPSTWTSSPRMPIGLALIDVDLSSTVFQNNHNNHNNQVVHPKRAHFSVCVTCCEMDPCGQPTSAAQRRRGRRLCAALRHERQSIAMALAGFSHNSSRGQRMASAGVWEHELKYTATIRDPPTPQPELFSVCDEEPGGTRPDRMPTLSGPQEGVLRRTVQQIVDTVPSLPILDDPAPQMVEQLPDILQFFDTLMPDPEQVIDVPKILPGDVSVRTVVREPQLAEQLVEVPTNPGYALAVVAVQTLGWRAAVALLEQIGAGYKYWPPRRLLTLRL